MLARQREQEVRRRARYRELHPAARDERVRRLRREVRRLRADLGAAAPKNFALGASSTVGF